MGSACRRGRVRAGVVLGMLGTGFGAGLGAAAAPAAASPTAAPVLPAAPMLRAAPMVTAAPPYLPRVLPVTRAALGWTWHPGCPVAPSQLRLLVFAHWSLDNRIHTGYLVLRADAVAPVSYVFGRLYAARFPVRSAYPVHVYPSRFAGLQADNTSAFVCRRIPATGQWDVRSFAATVDLNPVQNPTLVGRFVLPPQGRAYLSRAPLRPGMVVLGGLADRTFAATGWRWVRRTGRTDWMSFSPARPAAGPPRTIQPVVSPVIRADVPYSYRSGCPVGPAQLRRLALNHIGFDGRLRRGELVVNGGVVAPLIGVFSRAYAARFPVRQMYRVDAYQGIDERSMAADNTSAFNCRKVTGNPYRISQHSYGNAIDINTFENPYVTGSRVYPPGARGYLQRSPYRTGMILRGGPVESAFRARGWRWGARWSHPDYQHFSSNGG